MSFRVSCHGLQCDPARRAGGVRVGTVRRDQRRAAAARMRFEQAVDEVDAAAIEIRVRLVEQPQRGRNEQQARERDAFFLPGGQQAQRLIFVTFEADAGKRESAA